MPAALEISLQLELTEPISGVVRRPEGPEQHFDGWLELNATLERLHRGAREAEESAAGADELSPRDREEL